MSVIFKINSSKISCCMVTSYMISIGSILSCCCIATDASKDNFVKPPAIPMSNNIDDGKSSHKGNLASDSGVATPWTDETIKDKKYQPGSNMDSSLL